MVLVILVALVFGYMLKQGFGNNLRQHSVKIKGSPQTLSIFFISDTHNRKITKQFLKKLKGKVDVVIIGGDFADKRTSMAKLHANIKLLTELAPTYFVWGNNDREIGESQMIDALKKHHVHILCNEHVIINKEINPVRLCGIDFNESDTNIMKALGERISYEPLIFVSHNPEQFKTVLTMAKPALMLSGHYHGGQIRLGRFGIHPNGSFRKMQGRSRYCG